MRQVNNAGRCAGWQDALLGTDGESRHRALSYEHARKIEAQLAAEVAELMALAEAADQADVPDGMSVPEELARREQRLARIAEAKATIEARAQERTRRNGPITRRGRGLSLGKPGDPGRTGGDTRMFLEAVLWIVRTGRRGAICRASSAAGTPSTSAFRTG